MKPHIELLLEAAELLYGEHWPTPLGTAINVNPRTLRAIKEGRFDLPKDHPIIRETIDLLRERNQNISKFLNKLQRKPAPQRRLVGA